MTVAPERPVPNAWTTAERALAGNYANVNVLEFHRLNKQIGADKDGNTLPRTSDRHRAHGPLVIFVVFSQDQGKTIQSRRAAPDGRQPMRIAGKIRLLGF